MSGMVDRVAKAINVDLPTGSTTKDIARAAIEAMREPTSEMISAGDMYEVSQYGIQQIWQAMIDAALSE